MKEVVIKCKGAINAALDELEWFQGDLKTLSEENYEKLKRQILELGFSEPVSVWICEGRFKLLNGHQRVLTLKKMRDEGYRIPYIPCSVVEAENVEEAKRKVLSLTSTFGQITEAGLAAFIADTSIDVAELKDDFALAGVDVDNLPALREIEVKEHTRTLGGETEEDVEKLKAQTETFVKPGEIWKLGDHRLMCGDSTNRVDVEKLMNGEKADLWIADPPFGVSYMEKNAAVHGGVVKNQEGKAIKSDTLSVEELKPFWLSTAKNAHLVTTNKASNYWCACQGSNKMMMMMMMSEAGWNIRHELIWVKQNFVFGRCDYHYRHEPIIYGWKTKGTHEWFGDRKQDSVFQIDRPFKSDLHPTTKPVELFEKFILNSSAPGQKVFESFAGSGTTLVACEKNERISYSMELDPHYCSVIIERWHKLTGKRAELIE